LHPSEKELPERRFGAFRHKNTPVCDHISSNSKNLKMNTASMGKSLLEKLIVAHLLKKFFASQGLCCVEFELFIIHLSFVRQA
jgi:hypothetical protein